MPDPQTPEQPQSEANAVEALASQCVKCALCLPHCPTYKLAEDENESPRGRIALLQAAAQNALPLDKSLFDHIDRCLDCRACERVCPANVAYGELLDTGRALFQQRDPILSKQASRWQLRAFLRLLPSHTHMRAFHWLLWGVQKTGLRRLARMLSIPRLMGVSRFEQSLPEPITRPQPTMTSLLPLGPQRGTVALFLGCLTTMCDPKTLAAACTVLRHCGYEILIPPEQTCCGAVNRHAGDKETAQKLAAINQAAFKQSEQKIDAIISLATGCTVVLEEYAPKVVDLVSFLVHHAEIPTGSLKTMETNVWIHTPCTRRNVMREVSDPEALLAKIPGLKLHAITNPDCCGAAGSYFLQHPQTADALADKLLISTENKSIETLATTNIGCAIHLQQRLKALKSPVNVVHPVVLLAECLRSP